MSGDLARSSMPAFKEQFVRSCRLTPPFGTQSAESTLLPSICETASHHGRRSSKPMQQAVKHEISPTVEVHQLGRAPWRCALRALPPLASQGGLPVALPQHWCSLPPPLPAWTELQPHACNHCAENEVNSGSIVALTEVFRPLSLTLGAGSQKLLLKERWGCEPSGDSAFSMTRMASSISLSAANASGLRKGILPRPQATFFCMRPLASNS